MDKPLFSRKQLIQLLWPLIVEQFLSVFIGMVDVLMVAYVGEATVSGVSLVDSVNHLVIQVLFAVTAGGTVVCAQCIGGGDKKNAAKSGAQLLLLSFAVMLFVATIFFCGGTGILKLLFGQVERCYEQRREVYVLHCCIISVSCYLSFVGFNFPCSGEFASLHVGLTWHEPV